MAETSWQWGSAEYHDLVRDSAARHGTYFPSLTHFEPNVKPSYDVTQGKRHTEFIAKRLKQNMTDQPRLSRYKHISKATGWKINGPYSLFL